MTTAIEVQDKRSAAIARPQEENAVLSLVERFASNPDLDPEKAEKLIAIFINGQRKMLEISDEQAFAHAMADFKKNPPEIIKRKVAKMKGIAKGSGREYEMQYSYADLCEYTDAAMPGLAERGITWSFPFSESNGVITVSCILRYGLYSHVPTTLSAAADTSGSKNDIQAKGSTISYLERYTLCGATGLTAAMPDTDGKLPQKSELSEEQEAKLAEWVDALKECADLAQLKNIFADAYKYAKSVSDQAKAQMSRVYEEQKRKLQ